MTTIVGRSRSLKVTDLVPIKSPYSLCDFVNNTIWYRFRLVVAYWFKLALLTGMPQNASIYRSLVQGEPLNSGHAKFGL